MPAPLAEGGPVVVCDGDFDGALIARAAAPPAHHHDHSHMAMAGDHGAMPMTGDAASHEDVHAAWKHCPVGASFGAAAFTTTFVVPLSGDLVYAVPAAPKLALVSNERRAYYRSRAPPFALS